MGKIKFILKDGMELDQFVNLLIRNGVKDEQIQTAVAADDMDVIYHEVVFEPSSEMKVVTLNE